MSTHNILQTYVVVDTNDEVILMSMHNICFYGEIMKIIPKSSSNTLLICSTKNIQKILRKENYILFGHFVLFFKQ